jgi:arylformamidase
MKIYDISVMLQDGMTVYEGDPPFHREQILSIKKKGPVNLSVIKTGLHNGTHFDAPWHVINSGITMDKIDPKNFFGRTVVIEIRDKKVIDLPELEQADFQSCRKVMFKTTNSVYLEKRKPFRKDFVHFTGAAAEYLGKVKKMELVAIDYLSVDKFHSGNHPAHSAFIKNKVLILESVNLYHVKPGVYELFAAPLLIKGADGGPARVFLKEI